MSVDALMESYRNKKFTKEELQRAGEAASNFSARRRAEREGTNLNPHTPPNRFTASSTFSSPGSILGKEEDAVIFELNTRYLLAGIEGEPGPQCKISFRPDGERRVGDYRIWLPGYRRKVEKVEQWGDGYELWSNDIREIDMGLLADKVERVVREVYNKYLLLDAGSARLVLTLPSIVPHPVLETILSTLFRRWPYPSITLLPAPTMAAVSAGVRSALVVDIGWEEIIITAVYEYREIQSKHSVRAMKMLTRGTANFLQEVKQQQSTSDALRFDLEFVEEVLARTLPSLNLNGADSNVDPDAIEIEWPGDSSSRLVSISKTRLLSTVMEIFFNEDQCADDHELSLPGLLFSSLLALPPDVRGVCMSRVLFIETGVNIPGLRAKALKNVASIIEKNGWTAIRGKNVKSRHSGLAETTGDQRREPDSRHNVLSPPLEKDYAEVEVRRRKAKLSHDVLQGELREVRTLGPWSGASLLMSMKIRGIVEVDRDRFLSHGLAGASRDVDHSTIPPLQNRLSSLGISNKPADRASWTLAGWG